VATLRCLLASAIVITLVIALPAHRAHRARLSAPWQRFSSHDGKRLAPRAIRQPQLLDFEENQGQTDPRVKFLARGSGYTLFLSSEGATLRTGTAVMRLRLAAANRTSSIAGTDELVGKSHYFLGRDPAKWRTGILHYRRVKYREVYPGVDLVYYGNPGRLEYDFLIQPGADMTRIRFELDGADIDRVDEGGDLVIRMGGAEVHQAPPVIYQEWGGRRHFLTGRYVVRGGHQVGFQVEAYRADRMLIIDPVLAYSSFLGGSDLDSAYAVAVDASGNVFVAGQTASVNFPTGGPEQPGNAGGSDAFVTKLDPTGALIFSSYLGGTGNENNYNAGVGSSGVAVDSSGYVCLAGRTSSIDFPVVNAVQSSYGGGDYDAFVSRLSADGSALTYSSYFGGEANDSGNGIGVDAGGAIYVTGGTRSLNDFPITPGAFQSFSSGQLDAYAAKIDPTQRGAASLVYSTYLGGLGVDRGTAIAVDSVGNAYLTGRTESPDFPAFNSFQPAYGGGADAFVSVLNASGTAVIYSTFLGGGDLDVGNGIIVDGAGNAFIVGETASLDFPVTNAMQPANAGGSDAFVIELDPTGSLLLYGTYIGGSALDRGMGVALDSAGKIVITGETSSDDFPIAAAFQTTRGGGKDAFVARFDPSQQGATSLLYSSYLGGSADDVAFGIAVDASGDGWVVGQTVSTDFPIINAVQVTYGGDASDAFIARVANGPAAPDYTLSAMPASLSVTPAGSATYTATVFPMAGFTGDVALSLDGAPADASAAFTPSTITITDATAQASVLAVNTSASTPTGTFPLRVTATSGALQRSSSVTLVVATDATGADLLVTNSGFPDPIQVQTNLSYRISIVNQGPATATGVQLSDVLPAVTFVSATATQGTCSGTSTVTCGLGTLAAGSSATITVVVTPPAVGSISNTATVTGDQPDPNPANNSATVVTSVVSSGGAPVDVLQHHRNPTRDGLYIDPLITQAAATTTRRDLSFCASFAGPIYAQPLYVNNGPNGTAAFIVATEQNNVMAVAAADGSPIWLSNLGTPVPRAQLPCGNIDPLGITGTPVIDPDARAVYVAAMTTPDDGTTKQHQIVALSLDDGSILPGWPVSVEGIASGGATFDSAVQGQRDALLLNAGVLYVSYGGHFGDCGAYHGWVVAVPVADPGSLTAWATSAEKGGVWAPGGLATDGQSVFAITGNTFGATDWMGGEAIIRLGPGATFSGDPADYFAPSNWQQLDAADLDLGGSGPVLINVPDATPSRLIVALGKNGVAYLEDPGNLGGVGTGDGFSGEGLQSKLVSNGVIRNAAAAYTAPSGTYVVFNTNSGAGVGCPGTTGNLVALKIGASAPPSIDVAWCANVPGRGSPIVTTSDGTSEPVVWAVSTETTNRLFAFNGETGEILFSGGGPDEQMSFVRRFQTPIAVNGRIIVAADDQLFVFSMR
jgi:uncharacterized repeat protein (TIGR01451 family)